MLLRMLSMTSKANEGQHEKYHRVSNERRVQLMIYLCFPVVLSSSNAATPMVMSASRMVESRPKNPAYRTRVTECRYPMMPDESIVLASMNPAPREEFASSLKDCVNPRGFRWSAVI
jgi:hypothetical protein